MALMSAWQLYVIIIIIFLLLFEHILSNATNICRDKSLLDATKTCLSHQKLCRSKNILSRQT